MDSGDWVCGRCGQQFRSFDVPELIPTDHGNQLVHPECPVPNMPRPADTSK